MNLKFLTLFLFAFTFAFAGEFVFDDKEDFSKLKKKGIRIVKASAKNYKLELTPKKTEANAELLLNFENKKASELKDTTGNYTINSSTYAVTEGKALMGKRYASFAANNSYISVATNNGRLLNSVHFTEPFLMLTRRSNASADLPETESGKSVFACLKTDLALSNSFILIRQTPLRKII